MNKIVIIGKKNVGKSSLFNILTRSNKAIVYDFEGFTRDRHTKFAKIMSNIYEITDTAGLDFCQSNINILLLQQTWSMIKKSNIIIYMIDLEKQFDYIDINTIKGIKNLSKNVIYVINKIDIKNLNINKEIYNIISPINISIKKKLGIEKLEKRIDEKKIFTKIKDIENKRYKILVLGSTNVGKSSLVNKITKTNRMIVYNKAGTTRENICINFKNNKKKYTIIDTAGIRKNIKDEKNKICLNKCIKTLKISDMSIFVTSINNILTKQDLTMLNYINMIGKIHIIVINKSDLHNRKILKIKELIIKNKLKFLKYTNFNFISSKYGFGLKYLLKKIKIINIYQNKNYCNKYIKNILMNLNNILKNKNINIKLYSMKINTYEPLNITIYIKKLIKTYINYEKYIINLLIENFKMNNVPIKIKFKIIKKMEI